MQDFAPFRRFKGNKNEKDPNDPHLEVKYCDIQDHCNNSCKPFFFSFR